MKNNLKEELDFKKSWFDYMGYTPHKGQEKLVKERMDKFNEELSHWKEYDYVFVNDDLEVCYKNILEIINGIKKGEKFNQNLDEIKKVIEELSK